MKKKSAQRGKLKQSLECLQGRELINAFLRRKRIFLQSLLQCLLMIRIMQKGLLKGLAQNIRPNSLTKE